VASVSITRRRTKSGTRYVVRYRLGGRAYPIVHGGSFKTVREARERQKFIGGELAAGRNPHNFLGKLAAPVRVTLAAVADRWLATRVDLAESSLSTYKEAVKWLKDTLGDREPTSVMPADLQELVNTTHLAPSSLQTYMSAVKQIFDYAGVDPNPARGRRVRLPRVEREPVTIPLRQHIETIIRAVKPSYRLPLRILDATGVRVGELLAWTWGDVDIADSQILVRKGKTRSARRWVALPAALMDELLETCPPDDRGRERRLFNLGESTLRGVLLRACETAGIPVYSPHDFRHRYISVLLKRGLSRAEVAAAVGHSNTNELATYEHVVLEDV
jgi:integrase